MGEDAISVLNIIVTVIAIAILGAVAIALYCCCSGMCCRSMLKSEKREDENSESTSRYRPSADDFLDDGIPVEKPGLAQSRNAWDLPDELPDTARGEPGRYMDRYPQPRGGSFAIEMSRRRGSAAESVASSQYSVSTVAAPTLPGVPLRQS